VPWDVLGCPSCLTGSEWFGTPVSNCRSCSEASTILVEIYRAQFTGLVRGDRKRWSFSLMVTEKGRRRNCWVTGLKTKM